MAQVTGKLIIEEIVRNMREGEQPLRYSVYVPAVYRVYLHPVDYARVGGLVLHIADEARKALDEELEELNRPRLADRLGGRRHHYARSGRGWEIDLYPDVNNEVPRGELCIRSELVVMQPSELSGVPTIKHTTTWRSEHDKPTVHDYQSASLDPKARVLATITYPGTNGPERFLVTRDEVWIGRAGGPARVDVALHDPSVSRPHLRIRHVAATGEFYIENFGTFGATLDGQPIPRQKFTGHASPRLEMKLSTRARIGLANDSVLLEFEVVQGL